MPHHYIECPKCGAEGKVDETILGRRIKCRECGESFKAEVGGSYDVVRKERPASATPNDGSAKPQQSTPDPELERLLEKWAEE